MKSLLGLYDSLLSGIHGRFSLLVCCILALFNLPFSFFFKHLKRRLQSRGFLNKCDSDLNSKSQI